MKKLFALLLALTMVFALAACGGSEKPPANSGDNQLLEDLQDAVGGKDGGDTDQSDASQTDDSDKGSGGNGGKAWPAADYMPDGIAYAGGGEIVVVVADEGGHMIYVDGAAKSDFDDYVAQLESAGLTGDVTDYGGGAYTYGGESGSFYANLTYYGDRTQTTMDEVNGEIVDVEYNFHISLGTTN